MPGSLRALKRSIERFRKGYNRKRGGPRHYRLGRMRRKPTRIKARERMMKAMRRRGFIPWSELPARVRAKKKIDRAARRRERRQ